MKIKLNYPMYINQYEEILKKWDFKDVDPVDFVFGFNGIDFPDINIKGERLPDCDLQYEDLYQFNRYKKIKKIINKI